MKEISKMAKLATVYTNHSIRATHVTVLDEAGHEARHIMRTTGHKNEASIRSYSHRLSDNKKRDMADTIARSVGMQPQATVTKDTNMIPPSPAKSMSSVPSTSASNMMPTFKPLAKKAKVQPGYKSLAIKSIYDVGQCIDDDEEDDDDISDSQLLELNINPVPVEICQNNQRAISKNTTSTSSSFCPSINNCTGVTFNFYGPGFSPNQ
jgi:hypothetical protein